MVRGGEVDVEPHSKGLLLNGGRKGVRVLEDGDADGEEKKLRIKGSGSGEERS